ncbi:MULTISPECIES: ATP-binding cassette domain-containing protein [unclassified Clostridioides]|uniref:ATP-binding cassette domain-containing protein n=1 Tax=unclassified Clostridioides TaxID=2635829 RepID=UPI001D1167F1|nr:ATP-binding cassette domain-containing protein [Clostridioides sp. ES-S-0171-01]MCC0687995.1 ATP-binding cassette domain-containing protein [Clostridioides sp. ES-S-0056-01]MCC0715211.1 ATP-binding cassette domain-containing protein [Clostridioides sp. ES-S-0077-01]UDN54910.1 ATP-binding cassette domain-containing protein [Clostridioides sp. ES-S-0054-01]
MNDYILQTIGLTKKYSHTVALDNVNVTISKGRIYGFVGQNGAGKTTFMRVVSGLSLPNSGEIILFGKSGKKELESQRKRMGGIIEYPALYPYMTAHDNLEAMRIAQGIPNKEAVEHCLEIVGLKETGKKKVQNFSLGMKQRLGIGAALLGEPEFLMLDEPTNGLDPVSIIEIRELLKSLATDKQLTILVSSHILGELYQLATNYIFLHHGKIIQEITKEQLDKSCNKHISILVDNVSQATVALERSLHTRNYTVMPDQSIQLYDYIDDMQKVITVLSENHLTIKNIGLAGDSLENYFINTIGGVQNA